MLVATLACVACQTLRKESEAVETRRQKEITELVIDIDPFYNWGRYPKVRLVGREALQVQSIIERAPDEKMESIPPGMTVSPAPGLSVIEIGEDSYHIMPDCEVPTKRISLVDRLRLFDILSKHTDHFTKPKA